MGVLAGLEGRLDDDQPVGQDRAALDVKEVVAQLPGGTQLRAGVPAAKLRPPGDPRLHQMAPDVMRKTALQLGADLRALRPRPDERHVSAQHAPELGQLVEVSSSQEAAKPRNARIARL